MRIVFSRRGFDSQAGGAPSPIVDGRRVSLPIPTDKPARPTTTFDHLSVGGVDYGGLVELRATGSFSRVHPHAMDEWPTNNTVYVGSRAVGLTFHRTRPMTHRPQNH